MFRLLCLLFAGILLSGVHGWLFSRKSSTKIVQKTNHVSTNNCNCHNYGGNIDALLLQLLKNLGKRDAAAILDVDENYPGLDKFLEYAGMKEGTIDRRALVDAVRRAATQTSQSNNPNVCHCGRMVLDQFADL